MTMHDIAKEAREAVSLAAAHRSNARAQGFTVEAAEAMAVTLHNVLIASMFDVEVDQDGEE